MLTKCPNQLKQNFRLFFITTLSGLISGMLVSSFLYCLNLVTEARNENSYFIYGLPLVGLIIPSIYKLVHAKAVRGFKLILEEVQQPEQFVSWVMTPLIYITSLLSHLVGASVGRESAALQMSASSADKLAYWFGLSNHERNLVLRTGLSGGFAAALGAPWAGMFFGLEVLHTTQLKKWTPKLFFFCFISSITAWSISVLLKAPHFEILTIEPPDFSSQLLFHLLILALFIGLISRFYTEALRQTEFIFHKIPEIWRGGLGGFLVLVLYLIFPLSLYQGLGLESILSAFTLPPSYEIPLIKICLTILAIAIGFKGGDFIPLVFIGSTIASALAHHWQEPISFFAALGFVSLFGAASKTPLTCGILACELFGWRISTYAFLLTYASYATAGPFGIYSLEKYKD